MAIEAGPPLVGEPVWTRRPDNSDMASLFPKRAGGKGLLADVVMRCRATVEGFLADCTILENSQPGLGFDEATLKLAGKFRMRATDARGASVAGRPIRIPVRWAFLRAH